MGQNKAQKQAAERAKKPAAEVKAAAPTPAPATPAPAVAAAAPATPSKQDATIAKLRAGWTEKKVDLSKLQVIDDGKFKNVIVADGWPTVRVGASGGITVLELKSYPDAFTAAMEGDARLRKQTEREQKKAVVAAPVAALASLPDRAKETVTQKKGKQHEAVEQQSQSA